MKSFIVFFIIIVFTKGYSQNNADTVILISKKFSSCDELIHRSHISFSNDTFYLFKIKGQRNYNDSFFSVLDNNVYLITVWSKKNKRIEEGLRGSESFISDYKNYYKNGNIKSAGSYYKKYYNCFTVRGENIGEWTYYKRNGRIKKIVDYEISTEIYIKSVKKF